MSDFKYMKLASFIILKKYHVALVHRGLIRKAQVKSDIRFGSGLHPNIPKKIFMFWAQGIENAPELVRICVNSWIHKNKDWEFTLLTLDDVPKFLGDEKIPQDIPWAAYSNMLRVKLLRKYGGVWADATLLCERSLDDWIFDYTKSGFFAFAKPHPDRDLASWFLASAPGSEIISKWDDLASLYWTHTDKFHTYHWFHYTFEYLRRFDSSFSRRWAEVPEVSADDLHLVNRLITNRIDEKSKAYALSRKGNIPVSKLTYKHGASAETLLAYMT